MTFAHRQFFNRDRLRQKYMVLDPREDELIQKLIRPETPLEKAIIQPTEFRQGLFWGAPRFGHPEGKIILHIREVLDNVEQLQVDPIMRKQLRLITLVHDTFKYLEDRSIPRDLEKHHAKLARQYAEKFINTADLLNIIELHDEAFYSWRMIALRGKLEAGQARWEHLLNTLGAKNFQLYYLFFKCDTRTGDKIQAPVDWVEQQFGDRITIADI